MQKASQLYFSANLQLVIGKDSNNKKNPLCCLLLPTPKVEMEKEKEKEEKRTKQNQGLQMILESFRNPLVLVKNCNLLRIITQKNRTQNKSCFVQTALQVENELPVRGCLDFYSVVWKGEMLGMVGGGRTGSCLPWLIGRALRLVMVRLWILGMFSSLCDTHFDSASLILQMV